MHVVYLSNWHSAPTNLSIYLAIVKPLFYLNTKKMGLFPLVLLLLHNKCQVMVFYLYINLCDCCSLEIDFINKDN